MSDAFTKAALEYFGYSSTSEFENNTLLTHVRNEDKIDVGIALAEAIIRVDDPYTDNIRVFPEHMEDEYEDVRARGCCGSYDNEIITKSGNRYFYGFNYGH